MSRTSTTVLDRDGVPVVRHVAGPGPTADALRHEAEVLALVQGPGVVVLVDAGDLPDGGARLATRYVPGGTLAHLARIDGEPGALAALAQVARTLDRLHHLGVVHGRCTADHVVGDLRATALCGFGEARVTTDGEAVDASVDLAALAALVEAVVAAPGPRAEAARRAGADLAAGRADLLATADGLEALAARGTTPPAGGARVLHPRGRVSGTGAGHPPPGGPASPEPAPGRGGNRRRVVAGVLAVALVVAGAAVVGGGSDHEAVREGPVTAGASPTPPPAARPEPEPPPAPPEADAPVVEHDGARWAVGASGDLVAVGDWDCDGLVTAAVVRPADGVVWSFPSWEAADGAVLLGYVAAPVRAEAVPAGDGCDLLAVTTADGEEVVIGG